MPRDHRRIRSLALVLGCFTVSSVLLLAGCQDAPDGGADAPAGQAADTESEPESAGSDRLVTIFLGADGQPDVGVDTLCAYRGNLVRWRSRMGADTAWLVRFEESPFANNETVIESAENDPSKPRGAAINPNIGHDSVFPYVVKLIVGNDTIGKDPEIVIRDPGTLVGGRPCN